MNCAKRNIAFGLVVLWVLLAPITRADLTDFRVNDDSGSSEQDRPRVAVAPDGTFVIAWVDRRNSSADIYIQRFQPDGTRIGKNVLINDDSEDAYQSEPGMAVGIDGEFGLVWKDYRDGDYPFDPNIYYQKLDTATAPEGSNASLTGHLTEELKETPDIALSSWGGGMVVWSDYRNQNWDIYGQLIDENGSTDGAPFQVNDDTGVSQQHAPRVAVSSEGWYIVAWYDNRDGSDDIYVQRFDSDANPLGENVRINSDSATARQAFPDVATDGAGHFTVVWVDWRNGNYPSNPDIYARKYDTTMTPVDVEALVNADGSLRAQREPTIAADRRGNVAIIWSDSTGTAHLYDITGQMIDVDGVIREVNFTANADADSSQLHADVALDGRYRYVAWADKRNGNYDIYASVTKYNDPTLIPLPTVLRFEMLEGDPAPAAQTLTIEHAGYNPIDFELDVSDDWFAVSPSSGTTETEVDVSITTDTLPYGTYTGEITLIDLDNNDSTVQVPVRLDVTAPILEVTPTSLSYDLFAGVPDSAGQTVTVANAGSGTLDWSVTTGADWLTVDVTSGTDDAEVTVWANGSTLTTGTTDGFVVIDAPEAVGSPDTVWVTADAVNDQPYIHLSDDTIWVASEDPETFSHHVLVENYGVGALNWSAEGAATWLLLDRTDGTDGDSIGLTIDPTGLELGRYETFMEVSDPGAFHPVEYVYLILEYLNPSQDTVLVNSVQTLTESHDSLLIEVGLVDPAVGFELPLTYDPTLITPDSVRIDPAWPQEATCSVVSDSADGILLISVANTGETATEVGSYHLAWLFFSTGSSDGRTTLAEPTAQGRVVTILGSVETRRNPISYPGEVQVAGTTGVGDSDVELPGEFQLHQNYPNPFNPATTISFNLPFRSDVTLEVFNILGQRVAVLLQESLSVGPYNVVWDGRFEDGKTAPSGIYFYRLRTPEKSLVRKMVLVK